MSEFDGMFAMAFRIYGTIVFVLILLLCAGAFALGKWVF